MLLQSNGRHWLVHTPAKLNLYLEVVGRREDGFHELEMFMVAVDLYDTLRFHTPDAENGFTQLSVKSIVPGDIPADDRNLVVKTVELLRAETGCQKPIEINLTKRIPVQAGLGGGSSDAAATLVTLNRAWGLGLTSNELHELAARLGSDLNFFIERAPNAVCRGRGEIVEQLPGCKRFHFTVIHPGWGLSTADVFQTGVVPAEPRTIDEFLGGLKAGRPSFHNRLAEPATQIRRELAEFSRLFRGPNCMSGSGSAWFGLMPTRRAAVQLANRLRHTRGVESAFAVTTTAG